MPRAAVRLFAGLLATLLLAAALPASAAAKRGQQNLGALAYHRESGNFGYVVNAANTRAARTEALRLCGHPRCEVVVTLRNNCGAVANGPKRFSAANGATQQEAETKALRRCGERCEVAGWACTR